MLTTLLIVLFFLPPLLTLVVGRQPWGWVLSSAARFGFYVLLPVYLTSGAAAASAFPPFVWLGEFAAYLWALSPVLTSFVYGAWALTGVIEPYLGECFARKSDDLRAEAEARS